MVKLGAMARVVPLGKLSFPSSELYFGIYSYKDTQLNIGVSFGSDFFAKG